MKIGKKQKKVTHGDTKKRIYKEYRTMISRCKSDYHDSKNYYLRGIKVCDLWVGDNGYEKFKKWSYLNGYNDTLTLDRIDVNGNYEPSNCRWVTSKVQANNKRNNVYIEHNGVTKTLKEWSEELNLNYGMLKARHRRGEEPPKLFREKYS